MMSELSLPSPSQELNLRDSLDVMRRRKGVFAQVCVMVLAVGIVATALSKRVYQTHAKLLVPTITSSVNVVDSSNPVAAMLAAAQPDSVNTQLQLLQTAPFIEEAERKAGIEPRPHVVAPSVKVDVLEGTNVIQVTVEGGDPQDIANLAN